MSSTVIVKTSPSLAMIKYWGKKEKTRNIPATSSLAVTLNALSTTSTISLSEHDLVSINGVEQDKSRFKPFFDNIRVSLKSDLHFKCDSSNNFPTAAGLASSSSGFAALALGAKSLIDKHLPLSSVSGLARLGAASAARAVFGGFTILPQGSESAEPLKKADFWPDLRVIVVSVSKKQKKTSSRSGMELSRQSSPYYDAWLKDSEQTFQKSLTALEERDLTVLGPIIRTSVVLLK